MYAEFWMSDALINSGVHISRVYWANPGGNAIVNWADPGGGVIEIGPVTETL